MPVNNDISTFTGFLVVRELLFIIQKEKKLLINVSYVTILLNKYFVKKLDFKINC